jgi:hypothetical protein
VVQRYWLPTIRAVMAMDRKNADKAIELLRPMGPNELGTPSLIPVYERGRAYLMLHNGSAAAAEFQKIIDPRNCRESGRRCTSTSRLGAGLRAAGGYGQEPRCVPGFSDVVEKRGSRYPHPEGSQGGVREAAIMEACLRRLRTMNTIRVSEQSMVVAVLNLMETNRLSLRGKAFSDD